ncbi:exportin-4-like isoform X1 [Schistocerca gregaria]|uniref:exportin-4-like isoform X1 n=2 Tax=Schistocerca gregaria TaxID=7010 RepID=UPI00211DD8A5|nr:exportin-4-like isoform X1 [Schistocerca gregaria]
MGENIVGQLEEASRVLLASPNVVSSEQRHTAEHVFLDFRKSSSPYALCRHILETSKVDHVLFEAINLLKEALIREWVLLPEAEKETLLTYLMEYALHKTMPSFVHHKLLQVIAILIKRGSIDDFGIKRGQLLTTIEAMIRSGDTPKKLLGCNIILAILQEFAVTVKSSDVGLSFETHFKAKKQFEGTDLKRIFEFCVEALGEIMKTKAPYQQEILSVLRPLLSIADAILCWGFIQSNVPKRLIGVFETIYECEQPSSLRLTSQWKDMMLNPELLRLFFTIHWNVRQYPDMLQNSMNCIMQLASLNGPVIASRDERVHYAAKFMENFLELVSNIEIIDQEALGISSSLRKLIAFFPPALLVGVPDGLLRSMLNCLTHLTCSWCGLAIGEEQNSSEEKYFIDAFDNMLEVWVSILQDTYSITGSTINDYLVQIFDTYVQARLFPPHGIRKDDDEDSIEAFVDGDNSDIKSRYKEQLQAVGLFGRQILNHSFPLLASLIEQESSRLHEVMQKNQSNIHQAGPLLYKLHENLLWLVVIAGHVLSMDSDGEMSLIPSEIMRYSIDQSTSGEVDPSVTVQLMCTRGFSSSDVAQSWERCDHVVRLVSAVFRLCEVERQAAFIKELIAIMSPNLACNIMWFMKRWAACFLLPEERYYSEISPSLIAAFGRDGDGSVWCTNFLLTKVEGNLQCFNFDADVVKSTSDMLICLLETKEKAKTALKTEGLLKLLNLLKQNAPLFPQGCKRGLFKALIVVAPAVESEHRANYWNEVPKPLCDRFQAVVNRETLRRMYHQESVKMEIMDIIESFIGVSQGAHCTTAETLLDFLYPAMLECAFLVDLYQNYQEVVELILEFFCSCTRYMLCFLSEAYSRRLNAAALETVKVYTLRNKGRFSIEAAAEENAYQDIILLLELLTGLLSKDYVVDLVPSVLQHPVQSTGHGYDAADIVLFGLNTLMPLLSIELLKFPKLCLQYFKLITFVSELYPDKVCALPENMLVHLMESVALGLSDLGHDVSVLSFDLVEGLASHIYGSRSQASVAGATVKKFLEFIMKMILTRQVNSDAMTNAGSALYALICCFQDEYQVVVQKALNSQADEGSADRLRIAFQKLTQSASLNMDRQEKKKFRENFETFVADVSGFLFYK